MEDYRPDPGSLDKKVGDFVSKFAGEHVVVSFPEENRSLVMPRDAFVDARAATEDKKTKPNDTGPKKAQSFASKIVDPANN